MKLFLGFLLILLDFEVSVGTAVVEVLPDFLGYFLVMKALEERRDSWRHVAFGLMLVSLVLFGADLVDKATAAQFWFGVVEFVTEVGMLVLLFRVIRGSERMYVLFPVLACIRILAVMVGWFPLIGAVCMTANTIMSVCYLAVAYKPLQSK